MECFTKSLPVLPDHCDFGQINWGPGRVPISLARDGWFCRSRMPRSLNKNVNESNEGSRKTPPENVNLPRRWLFQTPTALFVNKDDFAGIFPLSIIHSEVRQNKRPKRCHVDTLDTLFQKVFLCLSWGATTSTGKKCFPWSPAQILRILLPLLPPVAVARRA